MELPTGGSDHILAQAQFWEKNNLPKCQGGVQNFGQVQMDGMKLNLEFQNNMILGSHQQGKGY